MKKEYAVYAVIFIVVIAVSFGWVILTKPFWQYQDTSGQTSVRTIVLDGGTLHVEVADNETSRELGLGGHALLASDEGMLFVFPEDGVHAFWMKGMTFPLDILWLTSDGTIVYIQQNLSPDTYPNSYGPNAPVRYVLEVNADYAEQNGVKVGDKVRLE